MNSLFGDTLDVFRLESDRNFTPKTEPEYIYRYSDSSEWTIPTIVTSQGDWKYDVVESESQFDIDAYNTLSPTVKTHNVLIKHNWDLVAVYPDYTW